MNPLVYRIVTVEEWEEMKVSHVLPANPLDERDGFIHLSLESQVRPTANRYFRDFTELIVLAFRVSVLGNQLRLETVEERRGTRFPHFYGDTLTREQVHKVFRLRNSAEGFGVLEGVEFSQA